MDDYFERRFNWLQDKLKNSPVEFVTDDWGPRWNVYRQDDVVRTLTDPVFSSERYTVGPVNLSFSRMDPPRHGRYRGVVAGAFTAHRLHTRAPRIAEIARELLVDAGDTGVTEVVGGFSVPFPIIVIAEILGVDPERRHDFRRWSEVIVEVVGKDPDERQAAQLAEMADYFAEVMASRRAHPREDLISELVVARRDSEPLSAADILGYCQLLLMAGNVTTTYLIANAATCLALRPELRARVRADRSKLDAVVDETLRYFSSVPATARSAVEDVTLSGVEIPAGSLVLTWHATAGVDPAHHRDPGRFDIDRPDLRHLAFSRGIHYCLGAPLAKLETTVALGAMLDAMPGEWTVDGRELEVYDRFFLCGVTRLPIRWSGAADGRAGDSVS